MVFVGATDRALAGIGGLAQMVLFSFPLCLISWGAGRAAWSRDRIADRLAIADGAAGAPARTHGRSGRRGRAHPPGIGSGHGCAGARARDDRARPPRRAGRSARIRMGLGAAFARIERMGRESLNEMRGLLGVLRSDDRGSRSPRPTLAEIDSLLEEARAGGRVGISSCRGIAGHCRRVSSLRHTARCSTAWWLSSGASADPAHCRAAVPTRRARARDSRRPAGRRLG